MRTLYRMIHNKYLDWRYGKIQVLREETINYLVEVTPKRDTRVYRRLVGRPGLRSSQKWSGWIIRFDIPISASEVVSVKYQYQAD
jgi:hypothetical protein